MSTHYALLLGLLWGCIGFGTSFCVFTIFVLMNGVDISRKVALYIFLMSVTVFLASFGGGALSYLTAHT